MASVDPCPASSDRQDAPSPTRGMSPACPSSPSRIHSNPTHAIETEVFAGIERNRCAALFSGSHLRANNRPLVRDCVEQTGGTRMVLEYLPTM